MAAEIGGSAAVSGLQVRVASRKLIKASDGNLAPYVLSFSNLDYLVPNMHTAIVAVYPKPPTSGGFASVVTTFEAFLPNFLNHYFPLAGRVVTNPGTGLPEVHCNNHGSELVVAHAAIPLAEVDFRDMEASINRLEIPFAGEMALSVQVVGFSCGGFCVTWATNQMLMDGCSHLKLACQWADFARTGKLSALPNLDRSIFRPRSPPTYSPAVNRALVSLSGFLDRGSINVLFSDTFVRAQYLVDDGNIRRLQRLASQGGRSATRLEAFSAYVWKILAELVGDACETCCMAWWLNGRTRLQRADALQSYLGNVIACASAEAKVEDVRHRLSLSEVAGMASGAIRGVAHEAYFQEVVDWVEEHGKARKILHDVELGVGSPAVQVSSVVNFPMDADFGFGQPVLLAPVLPRDVQSSAYLQVIERPNGDGSWVVCAVVWPKLARALESDPNGVFKPLTAESLGLRHTRPSRL